MNFKRHLILLFVILSSITGYSQTITPQWKSLSGGILNYYPGKTPAGYDSLLYTSTLRGIFKLKGDSVNNNGFVTHGYLTALNGAIKHYADSLYARSVNLFDNQTKAGSITFNGGDGIISYGTGTQQTHIADGGIDIVRDVGSSSAIQVRTTDASSRTYLTNGYFGLETPSGWATFRDTKILYQNGANNLSITLPDNLVGVNTIKWPENKSGTVALTSDMPSIAGLVPFTGATTSVDLGQNRISANNQTVYNSTGQAYTIYHNGLSTNGVYGINGMQSVAENNYSYNFEYNYPSKVGIHQYIDNTIGSNWWALGGRYARLQYAPSGAPNTGVNAITFTPGSGYTDGVYDLISTGGTGTNERFAITVSGGIPTSVVSDHVGSGYTIGDILAVPTLPGGSGLSITVASLATDMWGYTGRHIGFQVDNVTGTQQIGVTGDYTPPASSSAVQIQRSPTFNQAQLGGIGDGRGFVITGSNVTTGSGEAVYLNPFDAGNAFLTAGGGSVVIGNTATPVTKFAVYGTQATQDVSGQQSATSIRSRTNLTATADGDHLIGGDFDETFTPGSFANVVQLSARFRGAPISLPNITTPTVLEQGMLWAASNRLMFRTNSSSTFVALNTATPTNTQVPVGNSSGWYVPTTPTGTGTPVLATSPVLVTPNLGTPSALTLTNATGLPTAGLVNNAVTYAKMQAMTTNKLLGSGSGTAVAEITLGTGLSFTGTTLNSTNLTGSATLDFTSTAAQTSSELTITITGAADGDAVSVGVPNASSNANSCFTARVSATNTVTVKFNNYSTGAIDPASGTFKVTVFK